MWSIRYIAAKILKTQLNPKWGILLKRPLDTIISLRLHKQSSYRCTCLNIVDFNAIPLLFFLTLQTLNSSIAKLKKKKKEKTTNEQQQKKHSFSMALPSPDRYLACLLLYPVNTWLLLIVYITIFQCFVCLFFG